MTAEATDVLRAVHNLCTGSCAPLSVNVVDVAHTHTLLTRHFGRVHRAALHTAGLPVHRTAVLSPTEALYGCFPQDSASLHRRATAESQTRALRTVWPHIPARFVQVHDGGHVVVQPHGMIQLGTADFPGTPALLGVIVLPEDDTVCVVPAGPAHAPVLQTSVGCVVPVFEGRDAQLRVLPLAPSRSTAVATTVSLFRVQPVVASAVRVRVKLVAASGVAHAMLRAHVTQCLSRHVFSSLKRCLAGAPFGVLLRRTYTRAQLCAQEFHPEDAQIMAALGTRPHQLCPVRVELRLVDQDNRAVCCDAVGDCQAHGGGCSTVATAATAATAAPQCVLSTQAHFLSTTVLSQFGRMYACLSAPLTTTPLKTAIRRVRQTTRSTSDTVAHPDARSSATAEDCDGSEGSGSADSMRSDTYVGNSMCGGDEEDSDTDADLRDVFAGAALVATAASRWPRFVVVNSGYRPQALPHMARGEDDTNSVAYFGLLAVPGVFLDPAYEDAGHAEHVVSESDCDCDCDTATVASAMAHNDHARRQSRRLRKRRASM